MAESPFTKAASEYLASLGQEDPTASACNAAMLDADAALLGAAILVLIPGGEEFAPLLGLYGAALLLIHDIAC